MKKALKNIINKIHSIEIISAVTILVTILMIMSLQIFMRYILNSPLTWVEELALLLLVYLCYLAIDIAYWKKNHISIEFLINFLPFFVKKIIQVFLYTIICIFIIIIFFKSIYLIKVQTHTNISTVLRFTKSFLILPLALILPSMLLTTVSFILEEIQKKDK